MNCVSDSTYRHCPSVPGPRHAHAWRAILFTLVIVFCADAFAQQSPWVRPMKAGDPLYWGRRDGIVFGLISPGGIRGPRGLIRIGVYTPNSSEPQLLNFIAVEPVVHGPGLRFDRMAFSELEMSTLDPGQRGKRMWADRSASVKDGVPRGTLETFHTGEATVERLSVRIDVEKFTANGAHVYIVASIDSDHPEELRLSTYAESDSPPLDELTLTATMGNYERLRLLWLNDRVVDSRQLFGNYTGTAFVEAYNYPLGEMLRSGEGDAIAFCSTRPTQKNRWAMLRRTGSTPCPNSRSIGVCPVTTSSQICASASTPAAPIGPPQHPCSGESLLRISKCASDILPARRSSSASRAKNPGTSTMALTTSNPIGLRQPLPLPRASHEAQATRCAITGCVRPPNIVSNSSISRRSAALREREAEKT